MFCVTNKADWCSFFVKEVSAVGKVSKFIDTLFNLFHSPINLVSFVKLFIAVTISVHYKSCPREFILWVFFVHLSCGDLAVEKFVDDVFSAIDVNDLF